VKGNSVGAAEAVFCRIRDSGKPGILELIAERTAEYLFLDFKTSSNGGRDKCMSGKDTENLRRAISGCGNTEGGVVLWGVKCRQDDSGADVAVAEEPLYDVLRYRSWIENAVPRATVPVHQGVLNTVVTSSSDGGGEWR